MAKTLSNDLTVGSVPRQLIRFSAPLLLSGLLQTVYNMVDAAVVGQVVGSDCLAAVSIGGDITNTILFIANGFAGAGQVMISQFTGANQKEKIHRLIGTLFTFLFLCAVVLTVGCLVFKVPLLRWLNTPPESWQYALDYLTPCIAGTVFICGYNLVSAILRGMGDSRHPFIFVAVATVMNIVLDLIFVAVFGWAAFGAALATVISQAVSFALAIRFLYRRRKQFGFDFKPSSFRISGDMFRPLLKLGIPMVLQSAAINVSRLYISSNINAYGFLATAVTGIGNKLDTAINIFTGSLATAGGTMIGQSIGSAKYERVPKIIGSCLVIDFVVCGAAGVAMVLFPRAIFGLFASEAATLDFAMAYVPVMLVNILGSMLRPPFFALINGTGNAVLNLTTGLTDGVIARIGLSVLLGELLGFGIYGYWYGGALAGFVPFLVGVIYLLSGKWKTQKHILGA